MEFKPETEAELKAKSLAPAGDYDFEVLTAEDKTSKKGNPMIAIKIGLYIGEKITKHVFDYLMPSMGFKLRHFCDTVGLLARYEDGTLCADDCKGRSGTVKIVVDDSNTAYPPKNVVKDYVPRAVKPLGATVEDEPEGTKPEDKDDLPF